MMNVYTIRLVVSTPKLLTMNEIVAATEAAALGLKGHTMCVEHKSMEKK